MKKVIFIVSVLVLISISSFSQYKVKSNYYLIYFKDKIGNNYSIEKPQEFLSQKSIDRRNKFNISVNQQDLPVSMNYIDKLQDMGFVIKNVSKWFNCAVVYTTDSLLLEKVVDLDFVRSKPIYKKEKYKTKNIKPVKIDEPENVESANVYNYGLASDQVKMLNLEKVHNLGFDGKGVTIAVLDAGFFKVDKLPSFDSLWKNNQILGWYDFVDEDTTVFNVGTHGMMVLSTMGANMKDFVGTAPKANYYLFRTEDGDSEYLIEEFNYVCACEKADSLGVDLITSSLGYNDFDDTTMSYINEDLDGNTAFSTIGVDIAASKGIFVVTSAGNEGNSPWKYISAPADADSVLSVGAVNYKGAYTPFSSIGPTADGRIKPNVMGMGRMSVVQATNGNITYASGTSFSGPIIAGAVACLIQSNPEISNIELLYLLESCSSQTNNPDEKMGYGIPNFYKAYLFLNK